MLNGSVVVCSMLVYISSYARFTSSSGTTRLAIASTRFFVTVAAFFVSNRRRRYGRMMRLRLLLFRKSISSVY